MSILKALEKKQSESQPQNTETDSPAAEASEKPESRTFTLPEHLADQNLKIGAPKNALAFNGQSASNVGTALPEQRTDIIAGATLNAGGVMRFANPFPEFVSWIVDANRVEPRLVTITQPNSSYCEEYRNLRTQVLHKNQQQKFQSIVVASIGPAEGKSITALNLSWMLAQTDGVKALIIDSDLRMPSLADYLGIETDKGLSEILSERATVKDSIVKLEPSGLYVLPGGEARSDVTEMISGPKFKEILLEVREIFDYIIIDAPPLGIFTDAAVLINHADGALLVVRANCTPYSQVDRIMETLPRDRMMGVILNQSDEVLNENQYSYGYYNSKFQ